MSPKDNFAQTMKDLLGGSDTKAEEKKAESSISEASKEEPAKHETAGKVEEARLASEHPASYPYTPIAQRQPDTSTMGSTGASVLPNAPATAAQPQFAAAKVTVSPSTEVTIIAPGTKIVGDIEADGGLQIGGDVKGNIKVAGKLELNGKVIGDIEAQDISIISTMVKGNVTARSLINVDKATTIVGDVTAQNAELDGKVKGNLTAKERAHLQSSAILVGNLVSGTVNIEEGAMLKGDIAITSAQSDVDVKDLDFDIELG